jgi:hypothetical protein
MGFCPILNLQGCKGAYNRKATYVKNKTRKRTPKKYLD